MDANTLLSALRTALHSPSHRNWRRTIALIRQAHTTDGADVELAFAYVQSHLAHWPWHLRRADPSWVAEALETGTAPPWLQLSAALTLHRAESHAARRLLAQLPDVSSLELVSMDVQWLPEWLRTTAGKRLVRLGLGHVQTPPEHSWLETVGTAASTLRTLHLWGAAARPQRTRRRRRRGQQPHQPDHPGWIDLDGLRHTPLLDQLEELCVGLMPGLEKVAALPFGPQLRQLGLRGPIALHPLLDALTTSSALSGLNRLELLGCGLEGGHLARLVHSPHLERLAVLSLRGNPVGTRGVRELAQGNLGRLAVLGLGDTGLTRLGGLDAVAKASWVEHLRVLELRNNTLSEGALEVLGAEPGFAGLRGLWAKDGLDRRASSSWRWPVGSALRLEALELARSLPGSGPEIVRNLMGSDAPVSQTLRLLDLSGHALGTVGCMDLCRRSWPQLRVLRLRACDITGQGASQWMAEAEHFPRLEVLGLRDNRVSKGVAVQLASHAGLPTLAILDLENNQLKPPTMRAVRRHHGTPPEPALSVHQRGRTDRRMVLPYDLERDLRWLEEPGVGSVAVEASRPGWLMAPVRGQWRP